MLRMRTIEQAAAEIKKADPDTAITKYAIRQLVISREIPSIQRGNKYLINLDTLLAVSYTHLPAGGGGRAIPHADRLKSPRAKQSCFLTEAKKNRRFRPPIICGNARSSDIRYISAARQFRRMPLQMKRNACMCRKTRSRGLRSGSPSFPRIRDRTAEHIPAERPPLPRISRRSCGNAVPACRRNDLRRPEREFL